MILTLAVKNQASDLHLSPGLPPMMRVEGDLCRANDTSLAHKHILGMLWGIMTEAQQQEFEKMFELDFSFEIPGISRFRVNVFMQARGVSAVFRIIPQQILGLEELGLPLSFQEIASYSHGLVLVAGATGSGKSTTLAAIIDYINKTRRQHILTIEDPIEFVHESQQCLVTQREVRRDTHHFNSALRSALREDPDIILVGELRCLETIRLALTAAETGHLVFATLHTNSASQTINRIIDVFPAEEKAMVRSLLSESLQAVIAQRLLKKTTGSGRIPALEIMICNAAIRNLIREGKTAQIVSAIQTGQSQGMQTFEQHLAHLDKNLSPL